MAYTNINLRKPNMTIANGYFYMFDEEWDTLVEKIDDGSISFTYPLDVDLSHSYADYYALGHVLDTQYDGRNFWVLQEVNIGGYIIRRWAIENYVCSLRDEFVYIDTSLATYRANTFGVEHYITEFDCTVSGGNNVLCLDEYYDSTVASGVTLFLGPNELGEQEEVTVSTVSGSDVIVTSGTQYTYKSGDNINFYKSLFVFNDYDGTSSAKGTLYRFDAYTGKYMSSDVDADYKDVTASTFVRIKNTLQYYPDAHTLLYIKDTNAKLRNMSDLLSMKYASTVNDNFTGADYDAPNTTRWSVINGDPHILNNKLFMNSLTYNNESIRSNYEIVGDFDVQVSGALNGFTTASGYSSFEHYMKINFPHNSNNNCEIGMNYYDVPRRGLVAKYMMDSISGTVLYDTSGNDRHGTITGSPTTVSGITGNALRFRGTSQQDGVTLLSNTDAGNVEDLFFISVWFKSETTSGNVKARVVSRDCSDYWCIYVRQSTAFPQQLGFYYSNTQSTTINNVVQNKWHHIVAYWDVANTTCKLYLDNVEIFSTTSLTAFNTSSRPIVIGCNTEASISPSTFQFEGPIDDVRFYNRVLTSGERECLYNHNVNDKVFLYTALNGVATNDETLTSGTSAEYLFRLTRSDDTMNFYYKTVSSGVPAPSWTSFGSQVMYDRDCTISLGLGSVLTSVSGTYFDDLIFDSGKIFYQSAMIPYYGTMIIDNIRADQVTIIPVYNVAVYGKTLYRLQDEATYYGTNNGWGSLYNYQISPIRSFLDSIVVTAYPAIVPANAYNTVEVEAVVKDQYDEGVIYKPVYFTDDDSIGYITINPVYTDIFFGTGRTSPTYYKSGIVPGTVTIEGTATQDD
jgi:hypothetical protein